MIGKVSPHGQHVTGLIYYLFGPGRQAEHTDPHTVAGWRHPAELEPPLREDGRRDFRNLAGLLQQPHAALGPRGAPRPVWHCSVRAAPDDRILSDDEWAQVSEIMHHTGLAPYGQEGRPPKLVIADATTWPGVPIAAWPPAGPSSDYVPARGRGIQVIPVDTPLASWLPVKPGLTVHGLRHGHKTWMAEDGIPEILAEQRLGHQVPGMRGLYAHASERMRDDLKHALQARWEDSLRARAAISPRSPVPWLDELLTAEVTHRNQATPGGREKMISQNPPNRPRRPARPRLGVQGEPELTASDLARYLKAESQVFTFGRDLAVCGMTGVPLTG